MLFRSIFTPLNAHQVLIIVVDTRILGRVADSLQKRRFASICPTDYKNAKASICSSKVVVAHDRCECNDVRDFVGVLE